MSRGAGTGAGREGRNMSHEVVEILISTDQIAARVRQLGQMLSATYAGRAPVIVAVMKGCVLFLADLVRACPGPMDLEFVSATAYDGAAPADVHLALPSDLGPRIAGRPVLIVDDIWDTGRTLTAVARAMESLGAAEVRTLVLLRKRREAAARTPSPAADVRLPDWVGFEIPDRFVVGYGLDYRGRYRNLPYVAVLKTPAGPSSTAGPGGR
jgi:hypoxanthine phosphoribosyltransferase